MSKINRSIAVCDHTEYPFVASLMTKYFDKVYYCPMDWRAGFPQIASEKMGSGINGVENILSIWQRMDDIDIFLFPDIYFADIAEFLKDEGKYVWGSGKAEILERDRKTFLGELKKVGLPVPETYFESDFDKLLAYLDDKTDQWVKLSEFRGLAETFHWIDKRYNDDMIIKIKRKVGCFLKEIEWQVQEPIASICEYGVDKYAVDGKYPDNFRMGFEDKNTQYISKQVNKSELFKDLSNITDKMENILSSYEYTGFYSDEIKITDEGEHIIIDPCMRAAFPASPSYFHSYTNWGDIIWGGVRGKLVEPQSRYKYCAEIVIHSAYDGYNALYFDEVVDADFMACSYAIRDKTIYGMPLMQLHYEEGDCGIAIGGGDTIDKAIENCTLIVQSLRGQELNYENTLKEFTEKCAKSLFEQTKYIY